MKKRSTGNDLFLLKDHGIYEVILKTSDSKYDEDELSGTL
jgi:hypothetical protein